ncbi:MAG: phosphoenolpyruvate--protein phosphotransferase [Phycisphaerales bacterium]|nr:phosphoenolpyruvate--protein phosphotransferase [Phycisphaerales bacterium]MDP7189078.1 phosphoenolpyruvate--protein phosphotransferase [Phycisphaerales bacterium]
MMKKLQGIPVAPGIAQSGAFVLDQARERIARDDVAQPRRAEEVASLDVAIDAAVASLAGDRDQVERDLGPEAAQIFDVHLVLLRDKALIDPVRARILDEGVTAAYAVSEAFHGLAERFRTMGSPVFRDKARDVLDLERRILDHILGRTRERLEKVEEPVVLLAHELTPADAASLSCEKVVAIVLEAGGRTDHASIVASAIGVPVVVGCGDVLGDISDGDPIIVDGTDGVIVVHPDEEATARFQRRKEKLEQFRASVGPAGETKTADGTHIDLFGNIEFVREIDGLLEVGGDGVGLYRTEFTYLTSAIEPDEEELFEHYSTALKRLDGRPLTIRTLDLGADKYTQAHSLEPERNPFLGLRSIRYSLQNIPMFRRQLRAILRASPHGNLRVMFPLVTTVGEFRQAKMLLEDVRDELQDEGHEVSSEIPVGMMVEVPSAAIMASTFARVADFFSIGTNDLIQYTVAVDRGNERVASLYTAASPAVLRLVKTVVRAAQRRNVPVNICGECASDITYTMLLLGLGLRSLSLVPAQIPRVREVIRRVTVEDCERLARRIGSLDSERTILKVLRDELIQVLPEIAGELLDD